jgi:hypothetical protein
MNNAFRFFISFIVIVSFNSCKNCNTYHATDSRVANCFFKVGSYFVYSNGVDHIIDSQYVFQYATSKYVSSQIDECLTYENNYNMSQKSYRNGLFYDTIYSSAVDPANLSRGETEGVIEQPAPIYMPYYDSSISNFSVGRQVFPMVYKASPELLLEGSDTVSTDLLLVSDSVKTPQFYCGIFRKM